MSDHIDETPVNLPDIGAVAPAEGWPSNEDLGLLYSVRSHVQDIGKQMNLPLQGCGIGVGGADVDFTLPDGRTLSIKISISDNREGAQTP